MIHHVRSGEGGGGGVVGIKAIGEFSCEKSY